LARFKSGKKLVALLAVKVLMGCKKCSTSTCTGALHQPCTPAPPTLEELEEVALMVTEMYLLEVEMASRE
jgi:hypothetical protein